MANPWWVVADGSKGATYEIQAPNLAAVNAKYSGDAIIVEGPFATKAQADQFKATGSTKVPGAGTTENAPKPIGNPLTGLAAVGDFFSKLGDANTWIRVGEVVLGLILLAVGVARITHAQNFISTAVKAAAV